MTTKKRVASSHPPAQGWRFSRSSLKKLHHHLHSNIQTDESIITEYKQPFTSSREDLERNKEVLTQIIIHKLPNLFVRKSDGAFFCSIPADCKEECIQLQLGEDIRTNLAYYGNNIKNIDIDTVANGISKLSSFQEVITPSLDILSSLTNTPFLI